MSHELRTPLNSLLILAKLLADNAEGNLSPKQVEFAETIHGAGSDLLQLINDILDLSKVEAGKMDVSPTRIALVQLVDYVEATFRPLTAEKGLDFSVRVSPELPATLHTDEQRLLQVLRNLLSNAVKFTDSGAVELVIRPAGADVPQSIREQLLEAGSLRDADARSDRVLGDRHRHRDRGQQDAGDLRGVQAGGRHDQPQVRRYGPGAVHQPGDRPAAGRRDPRGRASRAAARRSRSICRCTRANCRRRATRSSPPAPCDAQGARRGGCGATRRATCRRRPRSQSYRGDPDGAAALLPAPPQGAGRRRSSGPRCPASRAAGAGPGAVGRRTAQEAPEPRRIFRFDGEKVLIVDDDIRNVFALTSVLEQHGLSVLYAENGREGIEVLEQHDDVTVVLMDIMMPEMDGYATTTAIRRMPQFAGLPIIALTAKAMKGDREKAIESGASDYVTKPVDPDHLLSVMEQWMRGE